MTASSAPSTSTLSTLGTSSAASSSSVDTSDVRGLAVLVADFEAPPQPAPPVELADVTELSGFTARPERDLTTFDRRKRAPHLGGETGNRLEREVAPVRGYPQGICKYLPAVGSDVDVGFTVGQRCREHRPNPDLLVQLLASDRVDRREQLGLPRPPRSRAGCSSYDRHCLFAVCKARAWHAARTRATHSCA